MSGSFRFRIEYNDKKLLRMLKTLQKTNSVEVRYGWWSVAKYPKRHRAKGRPVAQIAFWNEFGTFNSSGKRHIPPRPYLSQTGNMLKNLIYSDIVNYFKDLIYGTKYSTKALENIPMKIHNLFEAIVGTGAALSARTVELKGHDEHWKETGRLLKNFQVKIMKVKSGSS